MNARSAVYRTQIINIEDEASFGTMLKSMIIGFNNEGKTHDNDTVRMGVIGTSVANAEAYVNSVIKGNMCMPDVTCFGVREGIGKPSHSFSSFVAILPDVEMIDRCWVENLIDMIIHATTPSDNGQTHTLRVLCCGYTIDRMLKQALYEAWLNSVWHHENLLIELMLTELDTHREFVHRPYEFAYDQDLKALENEVVELAFSDVVPYIGTRQEYVKNQIPVTFHRSIYDLLNTDAICDLIYRLVGYDLRYQTAKNIERKIIVSSSFLKDVFQRSLGSSLPQWNSSAGCVEMCAEVDKPEPVDLVGNVREARRQEKAVQAAMQAAGNRLERQHLTGDERSGQIGGTDAKTSSH